MDIFDKQGRKIRKTMDGYSIVRENVSNKGRIFYDGNGVRYKCQGYNPKIQDCVYLNLKTGKHVVGCVEGMYLKNPRK